MAASPGSARQPRSLRVPTLDKSVEGMGLIYHYSRQHASLKKADLRVLRE
jgi:hypothetical protein